MEYKSRSDSYGRLLFMLIAFSISLHSHGESYEDFSFVLIADPQFQKSVEANADTANRIFNQVAEKRNYRRLPPLNQTRYIPEPRGVVVAGDLTNDASKSEWGKFKDVWFQGNWVHGVLEGYGNHDGDVNSVVRKAIVERNKARCVVALASEPGDPRDCPKSKSPSLKMIPVVSDKEHYYWFWQDIMFVQLNLAASDRPNADGALDFFEAALGIAGAKASQLKKKVPIVIIQHYGYDFFSTSYDLNPQKCTLDHRQRWTNNPKSCVVNYVKDLTTSQNSLCLYNKTSFNKKGGVKAEEVVARYCQADNPWQQASTPSPNGGEPLPSFAPLRCNSNVTSYNVATQQVTQNNQCLVPTAHWWDQIDRESMVAYMNIYAKQNAEVIAIFSGHLHNAIIPKFIETNYGQVLSINPGASFHNNFFAVGFSTVGTKRQMDVYRGCKIDADNWSWGKISDQQTNSTGVCDLCTGIDDCSISTQF